MAKNKPKYLILYITLIMLTWGSKMLIFSSVLTWLLPQIYLGLFMLFYYNFRGALETDYENVDLKSVDLNQ